MAIGTLMFSRNQFFIKIGHYFENLKAACTADFVDFDHNLLEYYFRVFTKDFAVIFLKS